MPYHLPILPATLVAPPAGWLAKESFSPSSLARYAGADGCKLKWAWGSIFGVWEVKKSIGQVLGTLIHACVEAYLKGGTVYDLVDVSLSDTLPLLARLRLDKRTLKELESFDPKRLAELVEQAPKRALAGLNHLPDTKDPALECVEIERWIDIDTTRIMGGVDPIKISGKIDLSVRRAGVWYLYDHKSTKGKPRERDPWAYVLTGEDLKRDPQGVFYALDVMLRHGLTSLWIRWVYYLTDEDAHPQSKAVDVELQLEDVMRAAYEWLLVAIEMREYVRRARAGQLTPADVPANENACNAYGGCPYSAAKRGGPCLPGGQVKLGDLILAGQKPGKEETTMSLEAKFAETQAALHAGGQPPLIPQSPLLPPEAHQVTLQVPSGMEIGPHGLRMIPPPGYQYGAAGHLEPIPPPPAPVVHVQTSPIPHVAQASAPPAIPEQPAPGQTEAEKRKGRPKGATNKPKTDDVIDRLIEAASAGHPVLGALTISQLDAIRSVLEAA